MNFQKLNIDDLHSADYNPRKDLKPADSEYQKIKHSIEKFGYVDPVIGGHQEVVNQVSTLAQQQIAKQKQHRDAEITAEQE